MALYSMGGKRVNQTTIAFNVRESGQTNTIFIKTCIEISIRLAIPRNKAKETITFFFGILAWFESHVLVVACVHAFGCSEHDLISFSVHKMSHRNEVSTSIPRKTKDSLWISLLIQILALIYTHSVPHIMMCVAKDTITTAW